MAHILVTGAEGRIGRSVVKLLLERGHAVRGYDLQRSPHGVVDDRYELIQGNLLDTPKVEDAVKDMDAVLHIAGLILYDDKQARRILAANMNATFEVLEAMARSKQKFARFVLASSGQVYPDAAAFYNPVDEGHPYGPTAYYGYAKLASEEMARFYWRKYGIPPVLLRFAHAQDPAELIDPDSEWSGPRFFLTRRLALMRKIEPQTPEIEETIRRLEAAWDGTDDQLFVQCSPDGRPYEMTIAHSDDMAQGVVLALEKDRAVGEAYNLGPAGPWDFGTAVPYMAQKLGKSSCPHVKMLLKPYHFQTSSAKARAHLGYQPKYDAFALIDEAVAQRVPA